MRRVPADRQILVERRGAVAVVTLDRPDRLNGISSVMLDELETALWDADDDTRVRVVVLRANGRAFSTGYDVSGEYLPGADDGVPRRGRTELDDDLWHLERAQRRLMTAFDMHKPVVAQVHGYCLAGGTDLALACDLVIAADDAVIGYPPVRSMGAPPSHMWTYLLGPQHAKRLLLTGDTVTGAEAARLGLVLEAVPADRLAAHVDALADRIALVDAHLLAANKRGVNLAMELMGARTMQRLAAEIDTRGHQAPGARAFGRRIREVGMKAALRERDAPFEGT